MKWKMKIDKGNINSNKIDFKIIGDLIFKTNLNGYRVRREIQTGELIFECDNRPLDSEYFGISWEKVQ